MTHGYFYICDQCSEKVARPVRDFELSGPSPWVTLKSSKSESLDFCSKKCLADYVAATA